MRNLITCIIFLFTIFSSYCQNIVTDRPDQTESSSTVSRGSLQIETGVLVLYTEDDISSSRQVLAPTNLFRYGVLKGIELRVLSEFQSLKEKKSSTILNGISDLQVGTKIALLNNEDVNTEVAFLSHVVLPTGTFGLTNNKIGTVNKFSISHVISESLGLGYNLGYNYFGEGEGDFTYSIAFGVTINNHFGIYIEPYGQFIDFNNHESSIDAGITYLVKNNIQLDFSFGTGINYNMNYLSLGCSFNIKKL